MLKPNFLYMLKPLTAQQRSLDGQTALPHETHPCSADRDEQSSGTAQYSTDAKFVNDFGIFHFILLCCDETLWRQPTKSEKYIKFSITK